MERTAPSERTAKAGGQPYIASHPDLSETLASHRGSAEIIRFIHFRSRFTTSDSVNSETFTHACLGISIFGAVKKYERTNRQAERRTLSERTAKADGWP